MSDDTIPASDEATGVVETTEAPALAWQDEPEQEEAGGQPPHVPRKSVVAVAALAGVAFAIAIVAGVVALESPRPQPDRFTIRPAPVQQIQPPAPPKASPAPKAAAPAPPPAAPPIQHVPQVSPNATKQFSQSLAKGHMWFNQAPTVEAREARSMCEDLADGGNVNDYVRGTEAKSPQLLPWEARQVVYAAIDSFCPEFDR